ncbi:NAD(P)-binding protein [Ammoniphilus sp. 3BR4]|uniref:NAD(P)-binding protein n=1 Tax=Ammoniphilus sp. 3BR4 TaxID=3158265 RepID=UPI0034666D4A
MMEEQQKHIMVIGGGITGLTAAYYIQKKVKEEQLPFSISLIEKSSRLGGKIQTEQAEGFVIEKGPDSFLARKPAIMDLSIELGLQDEMVGTYPKAKKNLTSFNASRAGVGDTDPIVPLY